MLLNVLLLACFAMARIDKCKLMCTDVKDARGREECEDFCEVC